MRLAAQMRGGFYPAHEKAVADVATYLRPPEQGPFAILDPCAGEGAAIRQLSELLGCPEGMVEHMDEGVARRAWSKVSGPIEPGEKHVSLASAAPSVERNGAHPLSIPKRQRQSRRAMSVAASSPGWLF